MQNTKPYRFVGSSCSLGNGIQLDRYGQKVELTEEEAVDYILHSGAGLVTEENFTKAGFADADLEKYPTIQMQHDAPAEFVARRKAVWQSLHDSREALAKRPPAPVAGETVTEKETT